MTMKTAIVGAGAMGSLLAHGMLRANQSVSIIDTPQRISCLRENGLRLIDMDGVQNCVHTDDLFDSFRDAGQFDLVVLATKSQVLPEIAEDLTHLMHEQTVFMTIQNGMPWWYFYGLDDLHTNGASLKCLDPDGLLQQAIAPEQIVGCVAYPAAVMQSDGSVQHVEGVKFPLGELDGSDRARTHGIADLLDSAGFKSRVIDDIRAELWLKAWGSLSFNPISALTGGTMSGICEHEPTRQLAVNMMQEAQQVAEKLGIQFRHTIEKRIAGAHAVGPHKTSMLQDREAGRALEVDALIGAILELAEITETDTPTISAVHACLSLLNTCLTEAA